jgi:mono/diheme cytochrome c family protein
MNKKVTKIISLMAVAGCFSIAFTSCEKHNANSPGVEFMPDMYRSPSLESNMAYVTIENGKETMDTLQANRMPVAGTIARGFMPYGYPNTPEGYEAAGLNLHNPLPNNEMNLKQGEELYGKFCVHCHGKGGEADGLVAGKLPGPPPTYSSLKNLPEGKMYHTITYGKGLMGAHAPLLSKEEIWKVVHYIHKLQFPNGKPAATDSTAVAPKTEEPKK